MTMIEEIPQLLRQISIVAATFDNTQYQLFMTATTAATSCFE